MCGRAIITGETDWTRSLLTAQYFETIPVGSGELLALAIKELAGNETKRDFLAGSAAKFYEQSLSNTKASSEFNALFSLSN
jgi:hypothetical protein